MEILLVSLKIGNVVDLKYFSSFNYLGQTYLPRCLWARWKDRVPQKFLFSIQSWLLFVPFFYT